MTLQRPKKESSCLVCSYLKLLFQAFLNALYVSLAVARFFFAGKNQRLTHGNGLRVERLPKLMVQEFMGSIRGTLNVSVPAAWEKDAGPK